jgi:hypothetical protein
MLLENEQDFMRSIINTTETPIRIQKKETRIPTKVKDGDNVVVSDNDDLRRFKDRMRY